VYPKKIKLQFQGGFVGQTCSIFVLRKNSQKGGTERLCIRSDIDWEDSNEIQEMDLTECSGIGCCEGMELRFENSTDFYGRVTIYSVEVWGDEGGQRIEEA